MDHTAPAPKNQDVRDESFAGSLANTSLANPRRIRVGADGRPISPKTPASAG